jgi:hypothetical protein
MAGGGFFIGKDSSLHLDDFINNKINYSCADITFIFQQQQQQQQKI